MEISLLDSEDPHFPDPQQALSEPDGLLAAGGNLSPATLYTAYRQGIFPWYQDEDPILWWSPATRCVIQPAQFHQSKSLSKILRRNDYSVTTNRAFAEVICACSDPRDDEGGTWITEEMIAAYIELHERGQAHSVEVWRDNCLIGGLYGVAIGGLFCGESMFSRSANASKIAMAHLCRWGLESGLELIDCQLVNPHLMSLGAQPMSRELFIKQLHNSRDNPLDWRYLGTADAPTTLYFSWLAN